MVVPERSCCGGLPWRQGVTVGSSVEGLPSELSVLRARSECLADVCMKAAARRLTVAVLYMFTDVKLCGVGGHTHGVPVHYAEAWTGGLAVWA